MSLKEAGKLTEQAEARGLTLAEYLDELKRQHQTEYRMAVAAGVYPFAIRKAREKVERQKATPAER